jgi:hypothetical protein
MDADPNDNDDLMEEERALELAEEKMLLDGDEEIESIDEHGNPVVDTEQVDRRNLTVALMNSVVETSSSVRPKGKDAAALRARVDKAAKEKAAQQQKAAHQKASQQKTAGLKAAAEASTQAEAEPHSYGLRKRKMRKDSDSDDSDSPPTSPRSPRMRRNRRSSGSSSSSRARQTRRDKEENVPNPLLQAAADQAITLGASSGSQGVTTGDSGRNRALSISLLNVPCPGTAAAPQAEARSAPAAEASGVTRRGRIFSIDIDRKSLS